MSSDIEVRRFAIKYTPPTIVIEYKKDGKLYMKKIRLNITKKSVWYLVYLYSIWYIV